ncbi:MAG: DNA polymerase III subunit beta [Micrococcales bacterium]|nr:MAG: DNA polymerase III subunit beta [Micrococcales bacterium]PIE27025.1 MAG: DNA polymerase III subunit beta [Micrococcales bacterium]
MKFTAERDVLAEAVTWTARTLPTRPTSTVLAGVLVQACDGGELVLSGFDYEVSARVAVPCDVLTPGEVLVSGRLLADIARSLPDRPVTFAQDGPKVTLTCGSSRFTLMTMPVEDYPARPPMPPEAGTVDAEVFAAAVNQVSIAASRDDTLPILTGVRMEMDDETVTLLSTDRYRLAMREIPWRPASPGTEAVALVRARTLSEVAKTIAGGGDVTLALSTEEDSPRGLAGFSAGGRQLTSVLVDGEYPKVRALFPAETNIYAIVQTSALIESVKRVALVAERNSAVRLSFTEGQLTIEAGQGEDAQATEALDAALHGAEIAIAFNPHFLLDGLTALGQPFVRLSFTQPSKPAVLTGQQELDGEPATAYRYLLMPVRLAG